MHALTPGDQLIVRTNISQMPLFSQVKEDWRQLAELMGLRFVGKNTPVPLEDDFFVVRADWEQLQQRLNRFAAGEDGPPEDICIRELTVIRDNPDEPEIDIHWEFYDPNAVAAVA